MPLFLFLAAVILLGSVTVAKLGGTPKIERSLQTLESGFRTRFIRFLGAAADQGKPLLVSETRRTPERQAWLYGSGRPTYVYKGVKYGRPGPWLTDRSPENPSEHQKDEAADTIPHPSSGVKADSVDAVAYLRSLEPLAKTFGLKNLPSKQDYGHWENA